MRTVVLGPLPPELESMVKRRQSLGQDLYDEVWDGEYHMAPAPRPAHGYVDRQIGVLLQPYLDRAGLLSTSIFNLGEADDYRVPDGGVHRALPTTTWVPTAAMVIEIVSPDDETWQKLDFYAAHNVDEVLIVDPTDRSVTLLALVGGGYQRVDDSQLLGASVADITSQIDWPPDEGPL